MTLWLLHQPLSAEEEIRLTEASCLALPFGDLPDLSMIGTAGECQRLMQALHPADPPEAISRKVERIWGVYAAMEMDDIIAVPLTACKRLALARVDGRYRYEVGEDGTDRHLAPVTWYPSAPLRTLAAFGELLRPAGHSIVEITAREARAAILSRLPHRHNRFIRWKWLMVGAMLAMGIARMLEQLARP